jgi:hypothetical protein
VELLPAKHQGKKLPEHAQKVPDYRIRRDWEVMASADGVFEEALSAGAVTRRDVEEAKRRELQPAARRLHV